MDRGARVDGRVVLLAAAALLLLPGIGSVGLWAPDEPRAAAVAREMFSRQHGAAGFVLLHLNGEAYTQKPPLYYWLVAAASLGSGEVSEGSARVPSALAGLATLVLTLALGARLFGARTALLGAGLLLTTYKFAHLSRRVQFDVLLCAFELGALLAFWRLDRRIGSAAANRLAVHACMGLALLTKGPVGFLIPVLVMAAYLAGEGRWRDLGRVFSPAGLALSLGPVLAWLGAAVALAPAGFFGDAVGGGLLARFFAGTSHARPVYYYLYQFPLEFLPWTLLWPAVFLAARGRLFGPGADPERARAWRFLAAWIGVTLLFFSVSAGKRGLYLLPCFPAAALLCADALAALGAGRSRPPRSLAAAAGLVGVALWVAAALLGRAGEVAGAGVPAAFLAALVAVPAAGAAAWWACVRSGRAQHAAAVVVACAYLVLAAAFFSPYPALDSVRSMKPVAEAALRWLPEDAPLALLGSRAMVGGLTYYSGRPVVEIDEAEQVPDYFARGGASLVMKERKLPAVRRLASVAVRERVREGDRALVVVTPAARERGVPRPLGTP